MLTSERIVASLQRGQRRFCIALIAAIAVLPTEGARPLNAADVADSLPPNCRLDGPETAYSRGPDAESTDPVRAQPGAGEAGRRGCADLGEVSCTRPLVWLWLTAVAASPLGAVGACVSGAAVVVVATLE